VTVLTVEGRAERRVPAERGTVQLDVAAEGADRGAVVAEATGLHARLVEHVRRLAAEGTVTRWSADRVRVGSSRPWSPTGEQLPPVHVAAVALEAETADPEALAALVEEAASHEGVTVTGVHWSLTDATRAAVVAEVEDAAVRDAVDRAGRRAHSLGLGAVQATAVADAGLLGEGPSAPPGGPGGGPGGPGLARALAAPVQDGAALDLTPEPVTVTAVVHARFTAS